MKRSFLSGLAILLPLLMTFWILRFLVMTLGRPFFKIVEGYLSRQDFLPEGFGIFERSHTIDLLSYLIIFIGLACFVALIGFLVRWYVIHSILQATHWLFAKTPFVNKIYEAVKETVETVFKDNKKNFGQAVLAPFPSTDLWVLGLITQEEVNTDEETRVSVLLPATPLPTIGFLVYYKRSQLKPVNLTVEETFKAVISGGLLLPSTK